MAVLTIGPGRNRSQPTATVFAYLGRCRRCLICHPLPPVATALLHKRSTGSFLIRRRTEGCWASAALPIAAEDEAFDLLLCAPST